MTDGAWINKEARIGVLPKLIPGQYNWVPHYRESYNIPNKVWDADSDAIYRESLPASVNYRTWESTEAPAAVTPAVTSTPKPEAQLAASLFRARQQSARNALGGLSPAEGVQRGIIPYEALAYF